MVSYIKGEMQTMGIWKQDPEVNISPKMDDNVEWRRVQDEELPILYRLTNIVRQDTFRKA